jgi:hypothetical protein
MNVVNNLTGPGIKTLYHSFWPWWETLEMGMAMLLLVQHHQNSKALEQGTKSFHPSQFWSSSCCGGSLSGRPTMTAPHVATSLFISDPNWGVEMKCRKFQILIDVLTLLFSGIFVLAWHLPTNLSCSGAASAGVSWDKHGQTCVGVSVWGMLRYVIHSWLIIGRVKIFGPHTLSDVLQSVDPTTLGNLATCYRVECFVASSCCSFLGCSAAWANGAWPWWC